MKIFLCITLLSAGMLSVVSAEEVNPVQDKKSAMEYFWKQIGKVSGSEVKRALETFNSQEYQDVLGETFLSWKDSDGNTLLHIIVLESNNLGLLKAVLSLGADTTLQNGDGKTAADLAKDKPTMAAIFESHENDAWQNKGFSVDSVRSEESVANQKLLVVLLMLGVAYYGWGNYGSHNKSVIV